MAYKRPGVYVEENLHQANPDYFPSQSAAAFVGVSSRGPTTPTLVESWLQFQRLYGGFTGTNQVLAHAVFQFYNNGGRVAWISRAVGSGAAVATRMLNDRQGVPAAILRVDAANSGAWGNTVYVEISDAGTGRFNLIVRVGGSTDSHIVERWTDLALSPADGRYAPTLINSSSGGSLYVRVTDQFNHAGGTYNPATHIPAASTVAGGDVLAAGVDGSVPTGGASGQVYTAVAALASVEDFLTLNVPEVTETALVNAIIGFAEQRGNIFVVIDCGANRAVSGAGSITGDASAYVASSYAAVYFPRIIVADPSNSAPGSTRTIAPGGAVVGQYAATDSTRGVHKAPAGTGNRINGAVGLEYRSLDSDLDALNMGNVNAIKTVPGVGYCLFGARTLKPSQVDRYINVRRTLINTRMALVNATRFAAFETNDEVLWSSIEAMCERILVELWQDGGLRGSVPEEAYYVRCDADNNPPTSVANGEVHIEVGVALQTPAEFIVLRIGQFEAGSSVTEEA